MIHCARPSPAAVPAAPSDTICVIMDAGQGLVFAQVPVPAWVCIRPGFTTPPLEVGARTHPPDSCMIVARMKRESTPDDDALARTAVWISLISSWLLLGWPYWVHDELMSAWLLVHLRKVSEREAIWDSDLHGVE